MQFRFQDNTRGQELGSFPRLDAQGMDADECVGYTSQGVWPLLDIDWKYRVQRTRIGKGLE